MTEATQASFGADLRRALTAWRRFPWLPIVSVAIGATFHLPDHLWPLVLVILVLPAGWVGTERICYLRAFRGKPIKVGELWRLTRSFIIRYSALGVAVGVPLLLVLVALSLAGVLSVPSEGSLGPSFIALYAVSVIVDVALTFVTPALAFTTRKVRRAFRIGLGMIRQEWPSCAWYVLVPPGSSDDVQDRLRMALLRQYDDWFVMFRMLYRNSTPEIVKEIEGADQFVRGWINRDRGISDWSIPSSIDEAKEKVTTELSALGIQPRSAPERNASVSHPRACLARA